MENGEETHDRQTRAYALQMNAALHADIPIMAPLSVQGPSLFVETLTAL